MSKASRVIHGLPGNNVGSTGRLHLAAHRQSQRGRLDLVLWCLFLLLFPFYLFNSGSPQPADWVMGLLLGGVLFGRAAALPKSTRDVIQVFGWFAWYAVTLNIIWSAALATLIPILFGFYYVYNVGILVVCPLLFLRNPRTFLRATFLALLFAVVFEVLFVTVVGSGFRSTGTFNNPNQLGYFSVLAASILLLVGERLQVRSIYRLPIYGSVLYLAAMSLSKAALGAVLVLLLLDGLRRPKASVMFVVGLGLFVVLASDLPDLFASVFARLGQPQIDDTFAMRGYDRILRNPGYLVFGAGEGAYRHFQSVLVGMEMHSSIGTLLFSYGVPGLLLFLLGLGRTLRVAGWSAGRYLLPALAYGVTHQGLRFSLFWVLVSLVVVVGTEEATSVAADGGGAVIRTDARTPR